MSDKTVAEKARVKPDATISVINEVASVVDSLGFPESVRRVSRDEARILLLFVRDRAELESSMPTAIDQLAPQAALWVLFKKGSKGTGLDMNRDDVWAVAERHDMRPLGLNSVDATWSVFRLRRAE